MSHRLLQVGMSLFLTALLIGLALPSFPVPRLGLAAHLLALMQSLFLIVLGLLWDKLTLSPATLRVVFWLALFGCFAPLTANLLGAAWAAGNTLLPLAAGQAHGSALQEQLIVGLLRSGGTAMIAVAVLVLWGLRK